MTESKKKVAVLGCTGSVGSQALDVISKMSDKFCVYSLTAHSRFNEALAAANRFKPEVLVITGECDRNRVIKEAPSSAAVFFDEEDIKKACEGADIVLLSILGIAALPAFEYCLKNRIPVALASKEAMVCGGAVARRLMDETKTPVYPVDSELSAIFQCLNGENRNNIERILLTASGGPLRTLDFDDMQFVTKEQALKHPTWSMGRKISIDSATLLNKGLEIMETRWLFDIPADKITVVVHPESIVHSAVEFKDGAVMAQLGSPDMRLPIQYALDYPQRELGIIKKLDLFETGRLTFEKADSQKFPCLALAYEAVREDSALQLVFNCADEFAVDLFLKDKIGFMDIPKFIEKAMNNFSSLSVGSFEDIYEADREIRRCCAEMNI